MIVFLVVDVAKNTPTVSPVPPLPLLTDSVSAGAERQREKRPLLPPQVEELETLQKLLHFPEEVALRLADAEYHLFYQVQPIDYLRHVTLDLGVAGGGASGAAGAAGAAGSAGGAGLGGGAGAGAAQASRDDSKPSVRTLINRFIQVRTSHRQPQPPAGHCLH